MLHKMLLPHNSELRELISSLSVNWKFPLAKTGSEGLLRILFASPSRSNFLSNESVEVLNTTAVEFYKGLGQ